MNQVGGTQTFVGILVEIADHFNHKIALLARSDGTHHKQRLGIETHYPGTAQNGECTFAEIGEFETVFAHKLPEVVLIGHTATKAIKTFGRLKGINLLGKVYAAGSHIVDMEKRTHKDIPIHTLVFHQINGYHQGTFLGNGIHIVIAV